MLLLMCTTADTHGAWLDIRESQLLTSFLFAKGF